MKLNEALSLIEDLEGSCKESQAANVRLTLPKLYIMESFMPFSDGYTLCIREPSVDRAAFDCLLLNIKKRGLSVGWLCGKYLVINSFK